MSKTISYQQFCQLWISGHTSTLKDALDVINGKLPETIQANNEDSANSISNELLAFIEMLVRNNLGGAISQYPLTVGEPQSSIRINPIEFIEWLETIDTAPLPIKLVDAKNDYLANKASSRKERPEKKDEYRTQALAEYFWSLEPELTKGQMAQKTELLKYGPIHRSYAQSTIEGWIRKYNPDRAPGRRKTKKL